MAEAHIIATAYCITRYWIRKWNLALESRDHLWNFERFVLGNMQDVTQKNTEEIRRSSQSRILVIVSQVVSRTRRVVRPVTSG